MNVSKKPASNEKAPMKQAASALAHSPSHSDAIAPGLPALRVLSRTSTHGTSFRHSPITSSRRRALALLSGCARLLNCIAVFRFAQPCITYTPKRRGPLRNACTAVLDCDLIVERMNVARHGSIEYSCKAGVS